jgi:hypothetical protein
MNAIFGNWTSRLTHRGEGAGRRAHEIRDMMRLARQAISVAAGFALLGVAPAMAQSVDCDPVGRRLVFCYPPGTWRVLDDGQPETIASYAGMNDIYAQFFVEDGGSAAGKTLDDLQAALMAGITGGVPDTEVPVIESVETAFWDLPARTLVLETTGGAGTAMITATLVLHEKEAMRLVTATQADSYAPELRQAHRAFLEQIRLVNPDG